MRLTDKDTGNQIVRTASITSFEPKRHGRKIEKVNLNSKIHKISATKIRKNLRLKGKL
jgi:hypothetical protein